jgi:hypothetical protein
VIIPGLNIIKYIQAHLFSCLEFSSINQFRFQGFEKTLSHSIIPTIAFATHTLFNIKTIQHIDRLFAGILNTPVGMENHVPAKRPAPIGHSDGRYHGVGCRHSIAHRPSNDFSVKKIQHAGQIKKSIQTRYVGNVRNAGFNRFFSVKIPIQQVGSKTVVVRRICGHFVSLRKFATQTHLLHMTCHSDSRYLRPCLLQISGQTGTAIAPLGSKISITDLFTQFHVLAFTFTLRILKPTVVATSGHFQNSTHHLNRPSLGVVVPYKLIDQRPLLEMMLSAFFNISRSVSASYKRFSKSAMRLASSLTDWLPFPGKQASPFKENSFRQRYNNTGAIPNSCASSDMLLRSKLNLTAFSLNALS